MRCRGVAVDGTRLLAEGASSTLRKREDAVIVRIALSSGTRKILSLRLRQAYARHITRLIRRIHALVKLADGKTVYEVAELLGMGEQTVRD